MRRNVHETIKIEYEKRQKAAFDDLQLRKREAFARIPRLEEIEKELMLIGVRYNKQILLSGGKSEEELKRLAERIDSLKAERQRLLKDAGFPDDFLEMNYRCPGCRDTGYIVSDSGISERCSCYKQLYYSILFMDSNLKQAESENFDTFDENYYPDIADREKYGLEISPRENIRCIKESCLKFIENFNSPQQKNLFFSGPAGVGKTFMANCIAMELIKRGATVLYLMAPSLFNIINEHRFKSYRDGDFEDNGYSSIFDVELLIIDDLGTEPPSSARYAELLNILNTRQMNNLLRPCKTIIVSNTEIKNLKKYYDERIVSRIIGSFDIFKFIGDDIRALKRRMELNGES